MHLDRIDAQEQLGRDLLVGRGRRQVAVAVWAAEREQDAALDVGELDLRGARGDDRLAHDRALGGAVDQDRAADPHAAPVAQPLTADHPRSVHEGPVRREPVVDDRPLASAVVQFGMQAGDLSVPGEAHVGLGAPSERARTGVRPGE